MNNFIQDDQSIEPQPVPQNAFEQPELTPNATPNNPVESSPEMTDDKEQRVASLSNMFKTAEKEEYQVASGEVYQLIGVIWDRMRVKLR